MEPIFETIPGGFDRNLTYLVGCPATGKLALIDAAAPFDQLKPVLDEHGGNLAAVLLTHAHPDHVASLAELSEAYPGAEIYAHPEEREYIKHLTGVEVDRELANDQEIAVGKETLKAIYTPGHRHTCVSFRWRESLFSGDTLFVEGCGHCKLAGADLEQQYRSLKYLRDELPEHIQVYPGHDYGSQPSSTIGREKANNPFFKALDHKQQWLALRG